MESARDISIGVPLSEPSSVLSLADSGGKQLKGPGKNLYESLSEHCYQTKGQPLKHLVAADNPFDSRDTGAPQVCDLPSAR